MRVFDYTAEETTPVAREQNDFCLLGETIENRGARFINRAMIDGRERFFVFARATLKGGVKRLRSIGRFDSIQAARYALGMSLTDAMQR